MLMRLKTLTDRVSSSLFFVPMVFVVLGVVLGEAMLALDAGVDGVPSRLTATVDSARGVLTTVAGATLAFAGIAFSVSLLLISLSSSQYSPRVVHGLFRDPFNKRVMGIVIGTFTYCLVVLRAVRGPLEDSGEPIVPSISTLLAVVLGVVSILAIVAFINHGAHTMDVSKILHRVTEQGIAQARRMWEDSDEDPVDHDLTPPPGDGFVVRSTSHGWVQQVDHQELLEQLDPGACVCLRTTAGRYVTEGTELGTIWPVPDHGEKAAGAVRTAVMIGETRTMQDDVGYGVRQLADVALKAMSPGVNDPTTAQDALFHLGSVLAELLRRVPPPARVEGEEGRLLLVPGATTHGELVRLAFDEVRLASATTPAVLVYLLEVIDLVLGALAGLRRSEARAALAEQVRLVLELNDSNEVPAEDRARVREAHSRLRAEGALV